MWNIYAAVSIGNTDNKLSQQDWSLFVMQVNDVLKHYGKIHFFGGASNWEPWQNVAWIIEVAYAADVSNFSVALEALRKRYKQDSIFILEGSTNFQGGRTPDAADGSKPLPIVANPSEVTSPFTDDNQ